MEEGSELEESLDELLRKMAEQPADAAPQLLGLKAVPRDGWAKPCKARPGSGRISRSYASPS